MEILFKILFFIVGLILGVTFWRKLDEAGNERNITKFLVAIIYLIFAIIAFKEGGF